VFDSGVVVVVVVMVCVVGVIDATIRAFFTLFIDWATAANAAVNEATFFSSRSCRCSCCFYYHADNQMKMKKVVNRWCER
jgi:hypothetical protein